MKAGTKKMCISPTLLELRVMVSCGVALPEGEGRKCFNVELRRSDIFRAKNM